MWFSLSPVGISLQARSAKDDSQRLGVRSQQQYGTASSWLVVCLMAVAHDISRMLDLVGVSAVETG